MMKAIITYKSKSFAFTLLLFGFVLLTLGVPGSVQAADSEPMGSVIGQHSQLTTFEELVSAANLDGFFAGQGNYTLLAPDNAAFAAMDASKLATLKTNANDARQFVLYHVLHGRMGSAELRGRADAVTVLGPTVLIEPFALIRINRVGQLTATDIESSNAVIHLLDSVLDPTEPIQPAAPPAAPSAEADAHSEQPPLETEPTPVPTATKPPWWVEPEAQSNAVIGSPHENPAFVDGALLVRDYGQQQWV